MLKTILSFLSLAIFIYSYSYGQDLPPKESYPLHVKQIHSGHSLTDPLFGQPWPGQYVSMMTQLRDTWAGDDIAKSTIPGSPMFWRWHNELPLQPYSARHNIEDWELLVITEGVPIAEWMLDSSKVYIEQYANNAWNNGNSADSTKGAASLLWTTWTNIDDSDGPWRENLNTYDSIWIQIMDHANANLPVEATPMYIIPGHKMMARLYDDIEAGVVPGIDSIQQFFSDNIHTNTLGDYAIAMIHYACIFNTSPVGLPNDFSNPNSNEAPQYEGSPSPELATYLQTMIWEVVTTYPRTGINGGSMSVQFIDFDGKQTDNGVKLNWSTAFEVNNKGFHIERSIDGQTFTTIGFKEGNGTSNMTKTYEFIDQDVTIKPHYYRLKQEDSDGKFEYSNIIYISSLNLKNETLKSIITYPNPSSDNLTILNAKGKAAIFDTWGKKVIEFTIDHVNHKLNIKDWKDGVYILKVQSLNGNIRTSRFLKM